MLKSNLCSGLGIMKKTAVSNCLESLKTNHFCKSLYCVNVTAVVVAAAAEVAVFAAVVLS